MTCSNAVAGRADGRRSVQAAQRGGSAGFSVLVSGFDYPERGFRDLGDNGLDAETLEKFHYFQELGCSPRGLGLESRTCPGTAASGECPILP